MFRIERTVSHQSRCEFLIEAKLGSRKLKQTKKQTNKQTNSQVNNKQTHQNNNIGPLIDVSTEIEMTSDARHNSGKAHYVKHCKCV